MATIEQNRPTDLHLDIRVSNPGMLFRNTPMTTEMQANLQQDVKNLVHEYLQHLDAPQIKSDAWDSAVIEVVSEDTCSYIQRLESMLQEVANDTDDDALANKIEKTLR